MSISKPVLKNPWASGAPSNIADPGGANETGIPYPTGKSIPGRWLNWILNKIETVGRYLVARGITDYDANESYSVGDRVQWGGSTGMTFVCIVASVGDGSGSNSPGASPTKWARWARGTPTYNALHFYQPGDTVFAPLNGLSYVCLLANGVGTEHEPHASPTYWDRWGHLDADIVDLIHSNENMVVSTSASGLSATSGWFASVVDVRLGYVTVLRDLSFTIGDAANGFVDITLGSPIAFTSGITNAQFAPAVSVGVGGISPYVEITGANTVRVHCSRSNGPIWGGYVRLLGY
jgi:hypothetical protein